MLLNAEGDMVKEGQQSVQDLVSGLQVPGAMRERQANIDYAQARTKGLAQAEKDKVWIDTPQGRMHVSPDVGAQYATKMAGLSLDTRRLVMDESIAAARVQLLNSQDETEQGLLSKRIGQMEQQAEYYESMAAKNAAETDSYVTVPITGEDGKTIDVSIKGGDYMKIRAGIKEALITAKQKENALKTGKSKQLVNLVDKLKTSESRIMGKDDKNKSNINNSAMIPEAQFFNQFSNTPYVWLWNEAEEEMMKIQLPALPDENGNPVQITARHLFQATKTGDGLSYLMEELPQYMLDQGVDDVNNFRRTLQ